MSGALHALLHVTGRELGQEGGGGAKGMEAGGGGDERESKIVPLVPCFDCLSPRLFFEYAVCFDGAGATGPDIAPSAPCCLDLAL